MSNSEDLTIRLGLQGQQQTVQGLDKVADAEARVTKQAKLYQDAAGRWRAENGRFASSAEKAAAGVEQLGAKTKELGAQTRATGAALERVRNTSMQSFGAGMGFVGRQIKYGATGLVGLTAAGTLWGLRFNAQVDNARIRFGLFTDDVDGLMQQVREIDKESATFGFAQLADAAAMLGNAGVKDISDVLRGAANAAAAGGRGAEGLQSIVLALSQIQNKGKVSQEEINQLNEAGAPGTQQTIAKAFGLTADELGNLGAEGLDATKAVKALTDEWTSGKMADAARRQGQTLGGQWARTTSNMQAAAGAATKGLADGLTRDVLPAANRAIEQITAMLGDKGLTDKQKLQRAKQIIRNELGPIAKDLGKQFRESGLDKDLEDAFEKGMNKIASVAIHEAPHIVKGFVDAWLGAGPWAKLISGGWIAHKLGLDKGAVTLLKSLGGGAGGGPLGKATKGAPIPVWVVNNGPSPDGKGGGFKSALKKVGVTGGAAARVGAAMGGAEGAALAIPALVAGGGILGLALTHNENLNTKGVGGSNPSNPDGHVPFDQGAPYRRNVPGQAVQLNTALYLDDRVVAKATHRVDLQLANRK